MTSFSLKLGLVLALLALPGCTATAPVPAPEVEPVRTGLDASALGATSLPFAIEGTALAARTMPVEYPRGVVEAVEWPGAGTGEVVLTNAYGQQVYRLKQGAPAQRVTIPAGRYSLRLQPGAQRAATEVMLPMVVTAEAEGLSRTFDQVDAPRGIFDIEPKIGRMLESLKMYTAENQDWDGFYRVESLERQMGLSGWCGHVRAALNDVYYFVEGRLKRGGKRMDYLEAAEQQLAERREFYQRQCP